MEYGAPQVQGLAAPPGVETCRFCGGFPALKSTARGHRGMIVVMQWRHTKGPFCRSCGQFVTRKMSADTLVQGWWGVGSFFVTWFVLAWNAVLLRRLAALAEPQGGSPQHRAEPGPSLLRRPQIWVLLLPVGLVLFVLLGILTAPADPTAGAFGG